MEHLRASGWRVACNLRGLQVHWNSADCPVFTEMWENARVSPTSFDHSPACGQKGQTYFFERRIAVWQFGLPPSPARSSSAPNELRQQVNRREKIEKGDEG